MNDRGATIARPAPGAFRCLVCQAYVRGTLSGHCPRCGFVPPSALQLEDRPEPRNRWPDLTTRQWVSVVGVVTVVVLQLWLALT